MYANRPFVARGAEGTFDCRWIQPATNIVTRDDRHWIYYVGLAKTHRGESSPDIDGPAGGIGLATLPLDRFVSLNAGDETGVVLTKPFDLAGAGLEVKHLVRTTLEDDHICHKWQLDGEGSHEGFVGSCPLPFLCIRIQSY